MTGERIPVAVTMNDEDFGHLVTASTHWATYAEDHVNERGEHPGWRQQVCDGRFEGPSTPCALPSMHWKFAYWVGDHYVSVILTRAFLASKGLGCEVVYDTAEDGQWVILTHYDHMWQRDSIPAG